MYTSAILWFYYLTSSSLCIPIVLASFTLMRADPLVIAAVTASMAYSISLDDFPQKSTSNQHTTDYYSQLRKLVSFVNSPDVVTKCPKIDANGTYLMSQYPVLKLFSSPEWLSKDFQSQITHSASFSQVIQSFSVRAPKSSVRTLLNSIQRSQRLLHGLGICKENDVTHSTENAPSSSNIIESICDFGRQEVTKKTSQISTIVGTSISIDHIWSKPTCSIPVQRNAFPLHLYFPITKLNFASEVIFFEFDLRNVTLNQCIGSSLLHVCQQATSRCLFDDKGRHKFELGNYFCQCKSGYYSEDGGFTGKEVEEAYEFARSKYDNMHCRLCQIGCSTCNSSEPCVLHVDYTFLLEFPLTVQSFCITACILLGIGIFKFRKCRVIKCGNWFMSEVFLFGAILLYASILPMRFDPSTLTCVISPWLRVLGFANMYGTSLVKVYRVLSGFQTRKAHRVHVRDKDVLRILALIIVLAIVHMLSWSAVNFDHISGSEKSSLNESGYLYYQPSVQFRVCRAKIWDIVTEALELGVISIALYFCHCASKAPSEYGEIRYITYSFIAELVFSSCLYIIRHFIWYNVNPNYLFLAYFLRCHLTVTATVALVMIPKFYYIYRPPNVNGSRGRLTAHSSGFAKSALLPNGDLDLEHINIAEMDPKDIRRELKKLYTNLELLRTKAMRKDNPHISRRRGGRKQRRFSMQPFHKKHQLSVTSAGIRDEEVSKLSEDSISVEESQAVLS